ncbi:MAG: tetratricopeptide repeat protein [Bacteroidota bacterium]
MKNQYLTYKQEKTLSKNVSGHFQGSFCLYRYVMALLFLIYLSFSAYGQTKNIDSLKNSLDISTNTERVDLLNKLSNELIQLDQHLALEYAKEADSLSMILDYKQGKISALLNLGVINKEAGNYSESILLLENSLDIGKGLDDPSMINNVLYETGIVNYRMGDYETALDNLGIALKYRESVNDKRGVADARNEIGNVNLFQSNYSTALDNYFEALNIREELMDLEKKAQTLNNIGLVYMYQENFDEALDYLGQSLRLKEKYGDNKTIARSHNNVGLIYEMKGELKKSLDSYFHALEYLDTLTDKSTITTLENNIGQIYSNMGDYKKALYYLTKCLKAKKSMGEKMDIAQAYTLIGKTYRLKSNYDQAINFGVKGLELSFEINSKKEIQEAASNLFLTYEKKGDYKKALKYHKICENYKDSLLNESQSKEIGRLEAKYLYDKEKAEGDKIRLKQEKIDEVKQTRMRIITFSGFALLVALFIAGVFYVKSLGRKNEIITHQKAELKVTNDELNEKNERIIDQNADLETTLNSLREMQTQLVQSEKMASLGLLTAGIAHEINNPVNFIYTGVNSLQKDFNDIDIVLKEIDRLSPDSMGLKTEIKKIQKLKEEYYFNDAYSAVYETLQDVKTGSERINDIVEGLRNFSRADKGEYVFADIHEGIEGSLLLLKNKYKNKIEIVRDYETNMPKIECLPGKLNQALLNVLNNAIDAIEVKGNIKISTKKVKNYIFVAIKDNGIGISSDLKERIFEPFYTSKDVGKGVGLGLSITYGIIKDHDGEINVESDLGNGTEFTIKLPIKQSYV